MSDERDKQAGDEELESLLRRLGPSPLEVDHVADLNRLRERIIIEREHSPARMHWSRVIPLTLVCTAVMFGFALFRYGHRIREAAPAVSTASVGESVVPLDAAATDPRFVPVSVHGTIVNTSSGGVVETEAGPQQRLNIEYRDAYHWHDPESGTNIRYFQPRNEEVIVPLQTD